MCQRNIAHHGLVPLAEDGIVQVGALLDLTFYARHDYDARFRQRLENLQRSQLLRLLSHGFDGRSWIRRVKDAAARKRERVVA